jgi:hypothetical protein
MSKSSLAADRGGSIYEVICLRKGINPRTATEADFFAVRVRANTALAARLTVRNSRDDVAHAFDAKVVPE